MAALADMRQVEKFGPLEDSVLLFEWNRNHTGTQVATKVDPPGQMGWSGVRPSDSTNSPGTGGP